MKRLFRIGSIVLLAIFLFGCSPKIDKDGNKNIPKFSLPAARQQLILEELQIQSKLLRTQIELLDKIEKHLEIR